MKARTRDAARDPTSGPGSRVFVARSNWPDDRGGGKNRRGSKPLVSKQLEGMSPGGGVASIGISTFYLTPWCTRLSTSAVTSFPHPAKPARQLYRTRPFMRILVHLARG